MDKKDIYRFVLENAIKFNGKANLNAVVGHIFANYPETKKDPKKFMDEAKIIVEDVNSWDLEKQQIEYGKLGKVVHKKKEEKKEVKLKNVVVRFAPNPNGPLTLGHCRPAILNYNFASKHKGKFILRFDDTDPKVKVPMKEAYKWIKEDLKYVGVVPNLVVIQSSRLETYYKYAEKLIKMDKAYVCTCEIEEKKKLTDAKKTCPCWSLSVNETLERWNNMFTKYKEEEAVLRIKTQHDHKNPALRDWAAFRIVNKSEHPLNKKAKVWPLLNFASAIDDHEFKVTHIIRGIDLAISDDRQKFIYDYLGWKYPETMYNGKLLVEGLKSTSATKELIKEGKYSGWDDIRLGTVRALRRRGIQGQAIKKFIEDIGLTRSDSKVSFDKLAALNKDVIDDKVKRYYVVFDPKTITIKNAPKIKTKIPYHKENTRLGSRIIETKDKFYVQDEIGNNSYRLMHLFNFKKGLFISKDYDPKLDADLIHWLPYDKTLVNVEVLMDTGITRKGLGEKSLKLLKLGDIVQFERNFFAKLEKKTGNKMFFVYCHN